MSEDTLERMRLVIAGVDMCPERDAGCEDCDKEHGCRTVARAVIAATPSPNEALTREVERRREAEARLAEMIEMYQAANPGPSYIEVLGWAAVTFGSIAADERERVMRFVEEAIEVAQAAGVMPGLLGQIIDRTYARPPGDLQLEMAQAGICLGTLAAKVGVDLRAAEAAEFARVKAIPKEEWMRRHAAKVKLGIAG